MLTNLSRANYFRVPYYGQIGAGTVVPFSNEAGQKVTVLRPRAARPWDKFVCYQASGDSLIGDGIFDGDKLICRTNFEASEVTDDKLVVVKLPCGSLLVKHFHLLETGYVKLSSSNPNYRDQYYELDMIEIKAIVSESIRHWD